VRDPSPLPPPDEARRDRGAAVASAPARRRSGRRAGRPSTRGGRRLHPLLIGANVVVAVALVAAGSALAYITYRWSQVTKVHLPGLVHNGQDSAGRLAAGQSAAMTILLIGNNTRTGLAPGDAAHFGTSEEVGGARSDVTMLLHLDPLHGASVLSIPRDLFVPMPPRSMVGSVGKIDAALNDSPEHLIEAITNDLGIPIDHFVSINFDGFQHVVDALGGINMSFPAPLRDTYSGLNITTTGCQHLNGAEALALVRARHLQYEDGGRWLDDPEGDLSRIRRDHAFLAVLAKTVKAKGFTNPLRANAVLGNVVNQVTIDDGMSVATMVDLLRRYGGLNPDTTPELTLPVTLVPAGNYHFYGGSYGSVVFPTEPADHQIIAQFLSQAPPASRPERVDVVDWSGRGAGTAVAAGLSADGFQLVGQSNAIAPAYLSETVIRYGLGDVGAAERVLSAMGGAVMMTYDPQVTPGTVVVDVGSVVTVTGQTTSTAPVAATAGTTTIVPTPGHQPITPSVTPLQSFDPTQCA
jgi:LCP family protein required for cell wall assembly